MRRYETLAFEEELEALTDDSKLLSFKGIARAIKQVRHGRSGWKLDLLSFRPLHDRGGPVALSAGADGPIGTLARIELNHQEGRPPEDGLPPDALNQPGAP